MDKVITAIQAIINAAVTEQVRTSIGPLQGIKKVFYGDPIKIPETSLPAIIIQPITTNYIMRGTRYDQKECNVEIRIVINRKDFLSADWSPDDKVKAVWDTIKKVEQQGLSQNVLYESICGLIQSNNCLKYTDENGNEQRAAALSTVSSADYVFTTRDYPTYEAVVRVKSLTIGDR